MFCFADVAQLVAHHLAKVRVAGSSPVIRSDFFLLDAFGFIEYDRVLRITEAVTRHGGMAEWRGNGLQSRVHGFDSRFHLK